MIIAGKSGGTVISITYGTFARELHHKAPRDEAAAHSTTESALAP